MTAKTKRVFHIAKELNISHIEILDFLKQRDIEIKTHMSPVSADIYDLILGEFSKEKKQIERFRKEQARNAVVSNIKKIDEDDDNNEVKIIDKKEVSTKEPEQRIGLKIIKKADPEIVKSKKKEPKEAILEKSKTKDIPKKDTESIPKVEIKQVPFKERKLRKVDIAAIADKIGESSRKGDKKTPAISQHVSQIGKKSSKKKKKIAKVENSVISESKVIKLPEFTSVDELARSMNVKVQEVIMACMSLGMMVTINQRLDMESMIMIADEFSYEIETINEEEISTNYDDEIIDDKDLEYRPPVVTVMGHVDHGKTSLLDYIRKENVVAGESGSITQHIGAYEVTLDDGKKITFLDTPGHAAFTAMRARGAQVTDVVIIIVAADDDVMPQTIEAIDHAIAAMVPIVFAINKIDSPNANSDKVKKSLSEKNMLVEEWGGKYQCQEISAKTGQGVEQLLEKILLESEVLDLKASKKANPKAIVVESRLDRGLGSIATVLVESGTLKVGDIFTCGTQYGKVRSLLDERGNKVECAYPSDPVQVLGFDSVPNAGDQLLCHKDEKEARRISVERSQIKREAEQRRFRKLTLDQIGQQISSGELQELDILIKGDVDGSIEALSDSLMELSTDEVSVKIIHKAVGMVNENDVSLAYASNAIIICFNVKPSVEAKALAKDKGVDIRNYSIIYEAISEVKLALEGLLKPEVVEEALGYAEVIDMFKIPKLGFIAGCSIKKGKAVRNALLRLKRDGEVVHEGKLTSLKRFKEDVNEVLEGFECGIGIDGVKKYELGDVIEVYEMNEVKRKLV